jgi:hypothetical protein
MSVAQEHICPFLVGGLKFDVRIDGLLMSVDPLRASIFQDGMTMFCTDTYAKPNREQSDSADQADTEKNGRWLGLRSGELNTNGLQREIDSRTLWGFSSFLNS